jgi:acyl carrier protein
METTRQQIYDFVLSIAQQKGVADIGAGEELTLSGIIDSLAIFRLVSFLEETFGIRIADDEIVNENFASVDAIERLVNAKLDRRPAPR